MGLNRLSAVHHHVASGDAHRGVRGGDFACGGGPILAVRPRGSASPDCDDPVYNPETERDINWNCVEMSGAVPLIQRVQQKR